MALNFSSLSAALATEAVVGAATPREQNGGGLVAELQQKFSNNKQPETQQMLAVLGACSTVLSAAGLPQNPTALFAASMSSLEKLEVQDSCEVGVLSRKIGASESFKCSHAVCTIFCTILIVHT